MTKSESLNERLFREALKWDVAGSPWGIALGWGSQVPEQPSRPCAMFLDPGRTEHARPLRRVEAAPAYVYNGGSHDEYFGAR